MADAIFLHSDYDRIVEQTIEEIKKLGKLKGGEYAGDTDRLANFRRNGTQVGLPMETIWAIYYNKHHDSVMQFIKDQRDGKSRDRLEPIAGRVDDMITYLILFKCMLAEHDRPIEPEKFPNPWRINQQPARDARLTELRTVLMDPVVDTAVLHPAAGRCVANNISDPDRYPG